MTGGDNQGRAQLTPRARIEAACADLGKPRVVATCVALLRGEDTDPAVTRLLGGRGFDWVVSSGEVNAYWLRVWGARGLLWAWDDSALPALRAALDDEHWRVREMAAKVVARQLVGAAMDDVVRRRDDPVPRVRAAAARAVMRLTDAGG